MIQQSSVSLISIWYSCRFILLKIEELRLDKKFLYFLYQTCSNWYRYAYFFTHRRILIEERISGQKVHNRVLSSFSIVLMSNLCHTHCEFLGNSKLVFNSSRQSIRGFRPSRKLCPLVNFRPPMDIGQASLLRRERIKWEGANPVGSLVLTCKVIVL